MSVDACLTLPWEARVDDVAKVIGMCCGLPASLEALGRGHYAKVAGISASVCDAIPTCCKINWTDISNPEHGRHVLWHHEWNRPRAGTPGGKGMMPPSTPFWLATCRRLVDFFGGVLDYQDCDAVYCDYRRKMDHQCNPELEGEPWDTFQRRILAVLPLCREEVEAMKPHAAYPDEWAALDAVDAVYHYRILRSLAV